MRALASSLRLPNAPSVLSNVALGYLLGAWYLGPPENPAPHLVTLGLAGLALYFSGNLANDWFDRTWDAAHRPERALPRGLYRPGSYLAAAVVLAAAGTALAFSLGSACGISALAIVALVAFYTVVHKRVAWSVIPMGLCRAGLHVMGATAVLEALPPAWAIPPGVETLGARAATALFVATHAAGLFSYIAGLSLTARTESIAGPPASLWWISRALLLIPFAAMSAWWMPWFTIHAALALVPLAVWLALALTRFRRPVPRLVAALLAGIPLVDFIAALPLSLAMTPPAESPFSRLLPAVGLITPLAAFVAGRALQRWADAT